MSDRLAIALHEAGHAVTALAFGVEVQSCELTPRHANGAVAFETSGVTRSSVDEISPDELAVVLMAGMMSTLKFGFGAMLKVCHRDVEMIGRHCRNTCKNSGPWARFLIDQYSRETMEIAGRLHKAGFLNAEDVRRLAPRAYRDGCAGRWADLFS